MPDPLIEELAAIRRQKRLSQQQVAEVMGTVQSAVSEIETGVTPPTLPVLRRYSQALDCNLGLMPAPPGMSGQPGAGCDDPRDTHPHWCGFCGAKLLFSRIECELLRIVPHCRRCGEKQWRNEVDELTAPDFRENTEKGTE